LDVIVNLGEVRTYHNGLRTRRIITLIPLGHGRSQVGEGTSGIQPRVDSNFTLFFGQKDNFRGLPIESIGMGIASVEDY
jgi:hypothetical protein